MSKPSYVKYKSNTEKRNNFVLSPKFFQSSESNISFMKKLTANQKTEFKMPVQLELNQQYFDNDIYKA